MSDLVERARHGDRSAFDELYERNVGRVYAICVRLTADEARAEELTQDVFVRAWEKIDSFRGDSQLGTWLYRMAVNRVIDAQRRRGRHHSRTTELGDADLPSRAPDEAESRVDLEQAVARLPDRARTALVLYAVEGFSYEEVAEMLGVALGTVKAHIHRARKLLMEDLGR